MAREKFRVCPVCEGRGTTVNPAIDCNGLTRDEFEADPDFAADYMAGLYDVQCRGCEGKRVVTAERITALREAAEDRRMAAREDGDWEAYSGAHDWRWGA